MKKEKNKVVNKNKKVKLILILCGFAVIVSLIIGINMFLSQKEKDRILNMNFNFSDNYKNFNVSVEDFYKKIKYEMTGLEKDGTKITVYNLKKHDNAKEKFNYIIKLSNGDNIYLYSNNGGKSIKEIKYDFSNNIDGYFVGWFTGMINRVFNKNLNYEEFSNNVLKEFFANENTWQNVYSHYVYNHFEYTLILRFDGNGEAKKAYLYFEPTKETDNKKYEEKLKKARDKLKKEQEKEEQEKKKSLAKKERIFTAGNYSVGTDIDPGTYNIIALSGSGNCFVDSTTSVIETFTPGGDTYAIDRYNNVKLSYGGTIEVTSTLKVKFEPVK